MGNRKPKQQGPQDHAEGDHGAKTRRRIEEQLQSRPPEEPEAQVIEKKRTRAAYEGKRRLVEDREQHDEAEKNSERERLYRDVQRGRADGPSDNRENLHGVLGSREHRADYKERGPDGLRRKE
jgi:hypothetical protein